MRPIHSLHILLRIPIVLDENDGVRTCQIQTQPAYTGREEQYVIAGIAVEPVYNVLSLSSFDTAIKTQRLH